jgi:hypothetical protein
MTAEDRWRCYRCSMTFLRECPFEGPVKPQQRLVCPDCGIIFGAISRKKQPITCWLIRLSDLSGIRGAKKIA